MTAVDDARLAAAGAAEQVRALNHAGIRRDEFRVVDVYAIVADLAALLYRLPQATGQLVGVLVDRVERGELGHDSGGDAERDLAVAQQRLGRVGDLAWQAGQVLDEVQTLLGAIADRGDRAVPRLRMATPPPSED